MKQESWRHPNDYFLEMKWTETDFWKQVYNGTDGIENRIWWSKRMPENLNTVLWILQAMKNLKESKEILNFWVCLRKSQHSLEEFILVLEYWKKKKKRKKKNDTNK